MSAEPDDFDKGIAAANERAIAALHDTIVRGLKHTFLEEGVKGIVVLLSEANVLGAVGRHLNTTQ